MPLPFPTTPIIDTFVRADVDPLTSPWTSLPGAVGVGVTTLKVVSNQCAGNGGTAGNMYYNVTYGLYQEVYVTLQARGAALDFVDLYCCGKDIGAITTLDAYTVRWTQSATQDTINITRVDNLSGTTLVSTNQNVAVGDSWGLRRYLSGALEAFYKPAAGAWASLSTATDSTYNTTGVLLMSIAGLLTRVSDFGGGDAALFPPTPERLITVRTNTLIRM